MFKILRVIPSMDPQKEVHLKVSDSFSKRYIGKD